MPDIIDAIHAVLRQIELEEKVRVLYACESGSRAWGFSSQDSDYDVRFLYIHPIEWYLSIDDRRDVIERPITAGLDVNGWDIRKALRLFRKSNPPLFEWLGSPIIYFDQFTLAASLRRMAETYYSPQACIYHYLHMAEGNYREYLKGETVWIKKYFYVLRPILATKWIEQGYGVVPTEFKILVDKLVINPSLRGEIDRLIARKSQGDELAIGPRIPAISEFIETEIERLSSMKVKLTRNLAPIEELDKVFRQTLEEAWNGHETCYS
jgi:uncharacterized protein